MGKNIPKVEVSDSDFKNLTSGGNPTLLNEIAHNIVTETKYYYIIHDGVEYEIVAGKDDEKLELVNAEVKVN